MYTTVPIFTIKLEASVYAPAVSSSAKAIAARALGATVNDHILCAPTYPLARSGIPRRVGDILSLFCPDDLKSVA